MKRSKRNINTLLIKPYFPTETFGTVSPWDVPHLGLAYIAAVLEKNNKNVSIIDAFIEKIQINELIERINIIKPDIIGITSNVYSSKYACYTALKLKKNFNALIVLGGPYATTSFNFLLEKNIADIVVLGEAENTFLELVEKIEKSEDISLIKGIAFKKNDKLGRNINNNEKEIVVTERRPYIKNLDELPFPAWHLFPNPRKYRNLRGTVKRPYLPIITSRGCIHRCIWCNKNIHGYEIRTRSLENVIEEILYFKAKYGIKEFAFMDDNFTYDKQRTLKFCYLLLKKNIKISINLYPGIRADSIDDLVLRSLKTVGVNRITIGIESGDQQIVNQIGKKINLKKTKNIIEKIKKYGFVADGFFMLGLPFDSKLSMEKTINYAIESKLDHAYFFITVPFPGTKLYEIVEENGIFLKKYFLGIPKHIVEGEPVYRIGNLNENLVSNEFSKSYKKFYFRFKQILRLIKVYGIFLLKYQSLSEIKWLISQFLFFITKLNNKQKTNLVKNE